MSQAQPEQNTSAQIADGRWKALYRAGAVAPIVTIAIYLTQMFTIIFGEPYPVTVNDWFSIFQRSRILALLYLNAFDVFSIALLGVMFLALYVALRRFDDSYAAIAAFFSFLGVAIFVSVRADMGATVLSLSDQYAAATTEAQMDQLLATGQVINSLGRATPDTVGFFFMSIGGLIFSTVMLRRGTFSKAAAYVGILGGVVTVVHRIGLFIAPSFASVLMPISGLLWLIWWILVSLGLLRLARAS